MKYAACPGGCGHKVGIREHNQVNFCCSPCTKTFFSDLSANINGRPEDAHDHGHSEPCMVRQAMRATEPVEPGDFTLITKSHRDKINELKTEM